MLYFTKATTRNIDMEENSLIYKSKVYLKCNQESLNIVIVNILLIPFLRSLL